MDDWTDIEPLNRWIRVEDERPKNSGIYICIFFRKPELAEEGKAAEILSDAMRPIISLCVFVVNGGVGEGYFDHEMVSHRVTHWMPLPPFPDEEEEG